MTFNVRHVGDFRYGSQDKDGNWTGLIGELVKGVILSTACLKISYLRGSYLKYKIPTGISFILNQLTPCPHYFIGIYTNGTLSLIP